jgi:hypothetical protein
MQPRNRLIKLYTIAYCIAIPIVIAFIVVMYHYTAPEDRKPITFLDILGIILFFGAFYFAGFIIVGVGFANRQFPIQCELEQLKAEQSLNEAIKGVTVIPDYSPPTDGPGRYRIQGVDQKTEQDTTLDIEAQSAANARIKAELRGVVVSDITKTA